MDDFLTYLKTKGLENENDQAKIKGMYHLVKHSVKLGCHVIRSAEYLEEV